jgi:GTP-binding protein HflX
MSAAGNGRGRGSGAGRQEVVVAEPGEKERAFLIAVDTGDDAGWSAEESLVELAALVETAGGEVVGTLAQRREAIHPLWYLGSGKAEELKQAKGESGFTMLVADDELSPKQQRSLEELLNIKVLDRSGIILDIFAQRAHTHEGRIQVELAQLEYQLPRLTRLWTHLSRMGGGIGTRRGPGETQLETDRRVLRERIKKTRERVEEVRRRRETAARARARRLLPTAAIVGYTNAGKSTLLNALVGEEAAAAEDMLFATLDPTTRRVRLREGQTVIVSDTVGFIHKLPHQLVEAFQATLEEVTRADILLEVVDLADAHAAEHRRTVQTVLDELKAGHKPRVVVLNKADLAESTAAGVGTGAVAASGGTSGSSTGAGLGRGSYGGLLGRADRYAVRVSALTGEGIDELRSMIATVLADLWLEVDVAVPYSAGELLARVRERGTVNFEYRDEDVRIVGRVPPSVAGDLDRAASAWKRARKARETDE